MWLLLETVAKSTATSYEVLQLVASLGMPTEIGRTRKGSTGHVWGVHMPDALCAQDAQWVLQQHAAIVASVLGTNATMSVTNTPPAFEQTRNVRGRADA